VVQALRRCASNPHDDTAFWQASAFDRSEDGRFIRHPQHDVQCTGRCRRWSAWGVCFADLHLYG